MRAAAVDEALVDPLDRRLTQTGQSIGPEGTRSLQARRSITWPERPGPNHSFNGAWRLALNASLHICIDVLACFFKKSQKTSKNAENGDSNQFL